MKQQKRLVGSRTGNGTLPVNTPLPRPTRDTMFGNISDGPYPYFSLMGFKTMAVHAVTAVATANVTVEVTNFDGNDPAAVWEVLTSLSAVPTTGDMAQETDLSVRYGRVVVAEGAAAEVSVEIFLS